MQGTERAEKSMSVDDAVVPVARERRSNGERSAGMRAALIEAAIQALCDLGYSRATTHEICRRAGATSGAIQHHFGSKDELVLATLEKLRAEMEERLESASLSQGTMEERCYKVVRELWETFYSRQRYIAVSEIAIGSRGDRAFYERDHRPAACHASDLRSAVGKNLSVARPDRTKLDAMHVTLSFLRGLNLYTNDERIGRRSKPRSRLCPAPSRASCRTLKRRRQTSRRERNCNGSGR